MYNLLFFGLMGFLLFSCIGKAEEKKQVNKGFPYSISSPGKVYELPKELKEISGIEYIGDDKLACVQDEVGTIFTFDLKKSKVVLTTNFSDKGDYEDIAFADSDFYILRSDGKIYQKTPTVTHLHNTPLSQKDDSESLCFNPENHTLIVGNKKGNKSFYEIQINNFSFNETPLFTLKEKGIDPTAIKIHPITKEYYILSKEKLVIVSNAGTIINQHSLSPSIFPQPEGIAFKPDGTMFISNEAKNSKATVLEFNYISYEQ